MKNQSLTFSRKTAKNLSAPILVIAFSFSFSCPSVAESLKELNLKTNDFTVRVYRQGQNNQLQIDIWDIKKQSFIVESQEVKEAEISFIKDMIQKEENQDENPWIEIAKIVLPPLSNAVSIFLLVVVLTWIIWSFVWKNSNQINSLINTFNIKSIGVGEFFTLEFEQSIVETYFGQGLGFPSVNDMLEIRNVVERLAPLVDGKRILWVDDHPQNNQKEISIFTQLGIEVQTVLTSQLAKQELLAKPNYYDLMISDWNRDPQQDENKAEGLRFLAELRANPIEIPVIFYHGIVQQQQLNLRRRLAKQAGAIGTTGSPGELLKWTMAGLVSKSLLP